MDGKRAEQLAAQYLARAGLTIIERNYRCRGGEIDLIANDGEQLVFVEVRYRQQDHFGSAAESINYHKQKRLTKTALHYLQKRQLAETASCRFDTICISPKSGTSKLWTRWPPGYQIQWLRNAFNATS
ncbi:YraN family protein [bacterium SCSIO 12696]|nr:YraN family protein [bacterium SCSIO 12696]